MKKVNRAIMKLVRLALVVALLTMIAPNFAAMADETGAPQGGAAVTAQTPDNFVTQAVYGPAAPVPADSVLARSITTGTTADGFQWSDDGISITITGYSGVQSGRLNIPAAINGELVTAIGDNAFWACNGFTGSLIIPDSVTSIGNSAFDGCWEFTGSLIIPSSVTSIGDDAFCNCTRLTGKLIIPDSVTSIGDYAFYGCGFTGTLVIPNSITSIGVRTFAGCSHLTSLTIPNSVTSIAYLAFEDCNGFTGSLVIPDSVTSIGWSAFSGCRGFTGLLTIPSSVTSIGSDAFNGCNFLIILGYSNTAAEIYANQYGIPFADISNSTIGTEPSGFEWLDDGTSITIIGYSGIQNGSLNIPATINGKPITSIGSNAFYNCSGFIGSLTIPNSVISIGNNAFNGCSGFRGSLIIPNSVISIGNNAFSGCSGIVGSLMIPNSVTSIGYDAFDSSHILIMYGYSNTVAESYANQYGIPFADISDVTTGIDPNGFEWLDDGEGIGIIGYIGVQSGSLNIPATINGKPVEAIGDVAFINCSGFTGSLTIPNSVIAIGVGTFAGCYGFTGPLTIPDLRFCIL